jgi:hypothetical protein
MEILRFVFLSKLKYQRPCVPLDVWHAKRVCTQFWDNPYHRLLVLWIKLLPCNKFVYHSVISFSRNFNVHMDNVGRFSEHLAGNHTGLD